MSFIVAPIVEGHGDVAALPVVLRLINAALIVAKPVRFPRTRLLQSVHLVRAARIAAANVPGHGAVLLVMDADEDCAATLGPELQQRLAECLPPSLPARVVLAVREFEAWIVGGDVQYKFDDPDAAGRLKDRIKAAHGKYSETADQPRLAARIDVQRLTEQSRSFRRLRKVVEEFAPSG